MSFSNKIIMGALRLVMRFSNPPEQDVDKIYAHAKAHNESRVFKVPKSGRIEYIDEKIHTDLESYHCLRIKRKGQKPSRTVLYICGGGGVYDHCRAQLFLAKKLLKWVDAEIYYPFYPPSTKHPIKEASRMIFETYKVMLNEYSHEKIGVVGLSAGGTAAMVMISWKNYYEQDIPLPALTIALSPGHVPANSAERTSLAAYRDVDPCIPVEMIEAYGQINRGGQDLEPWLIHTAHGDFRNAGQILLYFGEKESLAFGAPVYREFLKKAGADYRIHIEPGMPHCYAAVRINKTTRRTYDEIVALLNGL